MPTYTYKCNECDNNFEVFTTISEHEENTPDCPKCGCAEVNSVITGSMIQGSSENTNKSSSCSSCAGGSCYTCGG